MMSVPSPSMELAHQGERMTARLAGALSAMKQSVLLEMQEELNEAIDQERPNYVVLDISEVDSFGTGFVELLLQVLGRVRRRGGELSVQGANQWCLDVLRNCRLDQVVVIHGDAAPGTWWG